MLNDICGLVRNAAHHELNINQLFELRALLHDIKNEWPMGDPFYMKAHSFSDAVHISGIVSIPQRRPEHVQDILDECKSLMRHLDVN